MDQIDINLTKILIIACLYEILAKMYPKNSQRVLSVKLRKYRNMPVSFDTYLEAKAARDIITTPYTSIEVQRETFHNLNKKLNGTTSS